MSDEALEKWASEVMSRHCWGLGAKPCTLTREQGFNLMRLGYEEAERRGHPNSGTSGLGVHPTDEVPLTSVEVWCSEGQYHYTIFFKVDLQRRVATFYSEHTWCSGWSYGCMKCKKTVEDYGKEG